VWLAVAVSCAATSLHSLRVGCFVSWSAGCVFQFEDGVGLVPGLSPAPLLGSYAAVLSRGDLHQGFVEGHADRRRLPCIVGLVGDAGVLCLLSLLGDLCNGGEILST